MALVNGENDDIEKCDANGEESDEDDNIKECNNNDPKE